MALNQIVISLTFVAGNVASQVPCLVQVQPLGLVREVLLPIRILTYLPNAASDRGNQRKDQEQYEQVQDLSVDLSLYSGSLDRSIAAAHQLGSTTCADLLLTWHSASTSFRDRR
jgi:hypothetical protein